MMLRPRLSRATCLCALALIAFLVVTYFPFSRTRAGSIGASILPSAGKPLVTFKGLQSPKVSYLGSSDAVAALQSGTAIPTALAADDLNLDGAIDVIAGYSTSHGGALAVFHGNPDAFAPTDTTLYQKAMKGNVPPTFLSKATAVTLPESPDMIVTGDFNHDGYKDVLVAAQGSVLYLLAGDGKGNLLPATIVPLTGQVHAMAVSGDNHVAITVDSSDGSELLILTPTTEGLVAGKSYPLPASGTSVAWGYLGGGADLAVASGTNIVVVYNALKLAPLTETIALPFEAKALTLGDFIWDRDNRTEISVLASDGSIQILQHGMLNTAPLTAADKGRRVTLAAAAKIRAANPTAIGAWSVAHALSYSISASAGAVSASAFNSPHLAGAGTNDLLVLESGRNQLTVVDTSGKVANSASAVSFTGTPIAAVALPQKIDASRDLVVLTSAQSMPLLINTPGTQTYNVTETNDEDTANACTNSSITSGNDTDGKLSLRTAVCEANNAGGTSTINVPSGTYSLSISALADGGGSGPDAELQAGFNPGTSISIIGAGANSTIIQQTVAGSRLIEVDPFLAGNIPFSVSNVTLQNGDCTTGQDCTFGSGAILAGGIAGDTLTVTNSAFNNNFTGVSSDVAAGGAFNFTFPNLTVTNSTFNNNTANDGGGAIEFGPGSSGGNLSITGSTFTNNTDTVNDNSSGFGGAVRASPETGSSISISNSVFTGNKVTGTNQLGGAIFAGGGEADYSFSMSSSRIVGNTASTGNGVYIESDPAGGAILTNNWWGCNGGPGASGCDNIVLDNDGSTDSFNPWLVLAITANSTQINPNTSTGLTATIDTNSSGGTGFSVPNGTPISFGATFGTISGASTTLTSGVATATYNAGSTSGTGSATATVDNQEVSTTIDILVSVTVTTSPANLSITVDGVTATAPQTYSWVVGSSHTIATSSPQNVSGGTEQVFSSWSDGGAISHGVTAPSSSTTYTATFNTDYQLTTQASPSADGSVSPTSGQYFASGATIPVAATPNTDFAFSNWTSTGGTFDSTTSASTNFHMPAAATTVTGNFIAATSQITITTSPANLLVSVDGGSFVAAPLVETWNQGSTHTIATTSPQSGGSGIQYAFSSWSDGGAISHGITVPTTATTYTASFATQYQLTTAANPTAGGTVSPTSGSYYNNGTVVPLTATANAGYTFTNWTGNVANAGSATTSITMTSPQSVTANFSLIIVAAPTTTTISSNNNPSFTTAPGNSVTFTAAVSSNSTVNEGTVTFSDPANDFTCSGGNTVAVSNGTASCTTSFSTEGSRVITANYNGTVNFQTSSGMLTQTANNHTVQNGNQFCNQGRITVPSTAGAATPYPSNIFVTGLGNVGSLTVSLNNISSSDIQQTDLLLVGPTGAAIIPFASVGDNSTITATNIVLDDSASSQLPGGFPLTSGSFQPTSRTGGTSLVFPAPAPTTNESNYAAPDGTSTLTSTFQNTAANGTWALYAMDNSGNGAATIGGGWCVNITSPAVQTTITTSPAGLLVSVDGGAATAAPLVESWIPGSSHTIATSSPQAGAPGVQYVWSSWSDSGAISHSITVPSTPTTFTASFNTQYQLTTQASPAADGTVAPTSGGYYASGATIPVTATANSGFSFSNWTSTGGSFDSTTSASTNFHMPASPATVTGNFTAASVQITITTSPANLLVSVDGGASTAAPLVETWVIGSSHTIATSSPQSGGTGIQYVFSNWSDGGAISHSITVPSSPTTYTATFNAQYQLTTQASPLADGTVAPASGSYYASGAVIPVTATANAGFTFSSWTSTGGSFDSTTSASTNFHMPAAPATVTGNFATATVPITITTSPANLLVSVDGGALTAAPLIENWTVSSSHTIATTSPQSGSTGTQYVFSSWSDGGAISHSITVPSSATTYTASFATQYQLTTAANPSNGGTVSPTSGNFYNSGTVVPLTATANAGFAFSSWTGNVANSGSASTTIAMTSPQSVTANFITSGPIVTLNPTSINFGTQYLFAIKSSNVTVKNIGNATLTFSKVGITPGAGTNQDDFTFLNLCPKTLAAGKSCNITVFFFAGNSGSLSATLNLTDNAPGSPQQVSLSANVINPIPSYNPSSLHFGSVKVGNSATKDVILSNSGTTTLNVSNVAITGLNESDFNETNNCIGSIAPGHSCQIAVTFKPTQKNSRTAKLTVSDNAAIGTQSVPLSGSGE